MGFLDNLPFFRRSQSGSETVVETPSIVASAPVYKPDAVVAEPLAPTTDLPVTAEPAQPVAVPVTEPVAPNPAERAEAEKLVRAVIQELPDFVTVAILEQKQGRILAGQWAGHSGGAVEAAAANAEMVRQVHLALDSMQLDANEQLQDVVITLKRQLHLLRVLPQRPWLLYLAVRTQDTNLALAQTVLHNIVV